MIPRGFAVLTLSIWMGSLAGVGAEETKIIDSKPVYAALFKNGIGLVVSRAELPEASGAFRITPLPDAVLGSVWISWPDHLILEDIRASQAKIEQSMPAASLPDLLEANIGKTVRLRIKDTWDQYTIVDIPKAHEEPVQPLLRDTLPLPPPPGRGEIVILRDREEKIQAYPLPWVEAIGFVEPEPGMAIQRATIQNVVDFHATPKGTAQAKNPVTLTYLSKGIAWSPSYVVDISVEGQASLSAKAIVVNDLVPLDNTELELITGYPHIQFSDTPSTFSLAPLQQILDQLRMGKDRQESLMLSNMAVVAQRADYAMAAAPAPSMPSTPVMGEGDEDLYFYKIPAVTLKKGERGYYPLFSGEVPYEHLYTWEIPDTINEFTPFQQRPPVEPPKPVVWHALKLTNTTGKPWTTAPAVTMKNGRILGQDTIEYTPDQATTDLKITQALSISAEHNEYEIERQRGGTQFYGNNYDLVTVKGELAVTNFKDEPVTLEITKLLSGEVQKSAGDPQIVRLARGLRSVNPASRLVWKLEVKPGKENLKKLEYVYQVYVRS